jgi:Protein of unknown function (DUF1656)
MVAPRDVDLGGILLAPFVRYLFLALVITIAVRLVVGRFGLRSVFANPHWRRQPFTCASSRRSWHSGFDPVSKCYGSCEFEI